MVHAYVDRQNSQQKRSLVLLMSSIVRSQQQFYTTVDLKIQDQLRSNTAGLIEVGDGLGLQSAIPALFNKSLAYLV